MYKHVDDIDSAEYDVIDLKTNKRIPFVQWAEDEHGIYEVFITNKVGAIKHCPKCGVAERIVRRGQSIKIVKKESTNA